LRPANNSGRARAATVADGRCALVLHPVLSQAGDAGRSPEARLQEAVGLAHAIDLVVAHAESIRLNRPRPGTLFGRGTVERLTELVTALEIELVVIDGVVTPVQQRNLERAWNAKVIDRTGLILEIFGERARTREGQLQVELAALTYQRTRLVRSWTHLERQRGGFGFLGGPGETQLEMDRRLIGERIARIKQDLADVAQTRELHRRARRRVPYPMVALVGYTNAGKSTLFNRLTRAQSFAHDMLFATLDPMMRRLELPSGRDVILSDTVGFISDLPHELVAAFRATLEEVLEADLILHVRDVSHPETQDQADDVVSVLRQLGLGDRLEEGVLEVLNKIDLVDSAGRAGWLERARREGRKVACSALTGEGVDDLLGAIDDALRGDRQCVELAVPFGAGAALAWLYRHGEVMERHEENGYTRMRVRLDDEALAQFRRAHPDATTLGATG
jgi:GTP-binding protein HflX